MMYPINPDPALLEKKEPPMDIAQYRTQCEAEIAAAGSAPMQYDGSDATEAAIPQALATLADTAAHVGDRVAAMALINLATFDPVAFATHSADYDRLLHELATDKEKQIRAAALERLALVGDGYAQQLLTEGLEGKRRPLVPAAKAAQLLGSDDHNAARPILRRLAETKTGKVREEALRALANDTRSTALFEAITNDKSEPLAVRQIAAMSLKQTAPARFAKLAEKIVLDDDDDDRLRATAMSAGAHTAEVRKHLSKPSFADAVDAVRTTTKSTALKASIKRFQTLSAREA